MPRSSTLVGSGRRRLCILSALTAALFAAGVLLPATEAAATPSQEGTQALAQQIMNSGRLSGGTEEIAQIRAYANGTMLAHVIHGQRRDCFIDTAILQALKIVVADRGFAVYVASLNRFCAGVLTDSGISSYHWRNGGGHAIDISRVNGVASTGNTPQDLALIQSMYSALPGPAGLGQVNCHGSLPVPAGWVQFDDSCDHNHFEYRGGPSSPAPGVAAIDSPAAVIDNADRISLYSIRADGNLYRVSQAAAGGGLTSWTRIGGSAGDLTGRPSVLQLSRGIVAVYARTASGTIVGTNQTSPGGGFTPWTTIGIWGSGITGDPATVEFQNGGIGVYVTTGSGTVAGVAQLGAGGWFGYWTTIGTSSAPLLGTPALVHFADNRVGLFARSATTHIFGSAQTAAGSSFTAWSELGTSGAGVTTDPAVIDDADRLTVFAGAGQTGSSVTQPAAGSPFGAWVNLGSGPVSIGAAAPAALQTGTTYSAYAPGSDGTVWGTTVSTTPAPSGWAQIGDGASLGTGLTVIRTSIGVNCVYGASSSGTIVGTCQSWPGGPFGTWVTL